MRHMAAYLLASSPSAGLPPEPPLEPQLIRPTSSSSAAAFKSTTATSVPSLDFNRSTEVATGVGRSTDRPSGDKSGERSAVDTKRVTSESSDEKKAGDSVSDPIQPVSREGTGGGGDGKRPPRYDASTTPRARSAKEE